MSDVIIFPGLKKKLEQNITQSMDSGDFESAYDAFNEYEKHFELNEPLALLKLECLLQIESFLELREEAGILLSHGQFEYELIIPYFIEGLFKLQQYQTVVELIDALRQEEVSHEVIMKLYPVYDEAKHQLKRRHEINRDFISTFKDNDYEKQMHMVNDLIRMKDYRYQTSFKHILEYNQLHPCIVTLILNYLTEAGVNEVIPINKLNIKVNVNPAELHQVEENMKRIIMKVTDYFETHHPDLVMPVNEVLHMHAFILHPIGNAYYHINPDDEGIHHISRHYIHYFRSMYFEMGSVIDIDEKLIEKIKKLDTIL